jgi:polysaccharide deacetylase family protein (PEP-CTERM system associated)
MRAREVAPVPAPVVNAMSVDVEEHFHAWALSPAIPREHWGRCSSRVEASTGRVLELLAKAGVKATFFVLGCVAAQHKGLVRVIVQAGHELASHGHAHHKVGELDRRALREDVLSTRLLLEDQAGVPVRGYRAPSFSIGPAEWWAFEALAEAGYTYSSSLHPIRHDHYGLPTAPRHPFRPVAGLPLLEIPVATLALGRHRLSCAGGGHFRLLPYAWSRWALHRLNVGERRPATFYFHPWEIDPGQPRVPGLPWRSHLRHYVNLGTMEGKLARLLGDFRWGRIDQVHGLERDAIQPAWRPEKAAA